VALFGIRRGDKTSVDFVQVEGLRKAGHAAHPPCSTVKAMKVRQRA
jgi:hypothetical protein